MPLKKREVCQISYIYKIYFGFDPFILNTSLISIVCNYFNVETLWNLFFA